VLCYLFIQFYRQFNDAVSRTIFAHLQSINRTKEFNKIQMAK